MVEILFSEDDRRTTRMTKKHQQNSCNVRARCAMCINNNAYRLPSEGIVTLGGTLSRCVCVRRAACVTYLRLHAALVSAAKVMRCIQCSLAVVLPFSISAE